MKRQAPYELNRTGKINTPRYESIYAIYEENCLMPVAPDTSKTPQFHHQRAPTREAAPDTLRFKHFRLLRYLWTANSSCGRSGSEVLEPTKKKKMPVFNICKCSSMQTSAENSKCRMIMVSRMSSPRGIHGVQISYNDNSLSKHLMLP